MSYIKKLDAWLNLIGYTFVGVNQVSMVAVLGIAGEAGEVLEEAVSSQTSLGSIATDFIAAAEKADNAKKMVREVLPLNTFDLVNPNGFDRELADQFYYVMAAAKSRGLTLENLAEMSYDKVTERNKKQVIK